jgi:phosphatidate cytidylyltransferase
MKTRIILGSLLLAVIAGLFALDHVLGTRAIISSLVVLLGLVAWYELSALSGVADPSRGGSRLLFVVGLLGTAYFLALGWWAGAGGHETAAHVVGGISGIVLAAFSCVVFRADHRAGFLPLLVTIMGTILYGLFHSYLLRIYHSAQGLEAAVVFLLGVKGNDIAAYFTGKYLGRHRFLAVSPRKTVEGSVGALVFSAAWFGGASALAQGLVFPWPLGALFGIIVSIASQLGDVSESLIKRYYESKDSSVLLPEFGGVLDMIDSFAYCGFLFWVFLGP